MSAGEFFVAAVVAGMVLAIIAFSIRHSTRDAGAARDSPGASGVDPGIAHLMTPGTFRGGDSHAAGHSGHHGHHGHDHASHGSFDSCAPVDSGGGIDDGGGGDGGGGGGDGGGGDGGGGD